MPNAGDVPPKLEGSAVVYFNNALYLAGGEAMYETDPFVEKFWKYDLNTNK